MAKTKMTEALENALDEKCRSAGEYGCREVTIGFAHDGHGDEIVDFMSMDSRSVFRCYELKVSLADLKSEAKKSWYGDYNYLVVSEKLYAADPVWENYIPPYAGILSGEGLKVRRKAARRTISDEQREMLKDSLLRSVFWKMDGFRQSGSHDAYKQLRKQYQDLCDENDRLKIDCEKQLWAYRDYEHYYRLNHGDESFSAQTQAKTERSQYFRRKKDGFTWENRDGRTVCPHCGREAVMKDDQYITTPFCPWCGTDLR